MTTKDSAAWHIPRHIKFLLWFKRMKVSCDVSMGVSTFIFYKTLFGKVYVLKEETYESN